MTDDGTGTGKSARQAEGVEYCEERVSHEKIPHHRDKEQPDGWISDMRQDDIVGSKPTHLPPAADGVEYSDIRVTSQTVPDPSDVKQPIVWMPVPTTSIPDCPPGLECLAMVDQLIIHQKRNAMQAFTGIDNNNKYVILNALGQQMYYACENSGYIAVNLLGAERPFEMGIVDSAEREVIHISRPMAFLQSMKVFAPPGNRIGGIKQDFTFLHPSFRILNANKETVLMLSGPIIKASFGGDVDFKVHSADGVTQVGKISKQWSGLSREVFLRSDNFGIQFPGDLCVDTKALLLAATVLIDYMYYERGRDPNQPR